MMGKLRQMPIKNERDKPSTGKDAGHKTVKLGTIAFVLLFGII